MNGDFTREEVKQITVDRPAEARQKIDDLRRLEMALSEMAAQCDKGTVPECTVIEALFEGSGSRNTLEG